MRTITGYEITAEVEVSHDPDEWERARALDAHDTDEGQDS